MDLDPIEDATSAASATSVESDVAAPNPKQTARRERAQTAQEEKKLSLYNFMLRLDSAEVANTFISYFYKHYEYVPIEFRFLKCVNLARVKGLEQEISALMSQCKAFLNGKERTLLNNWLQAKSVNFFSTLSNSRTGKEFQILDKLLLLDDGSVMYNLCRIFVNLIDSSPILMLVQFKGQKVSAEMQVWKTMVADDEQVKWRLFSDNSLPIEIADEITELAGPFPYKKLVAEMQELRARRRRR